VDERVVGDVVDPLLILLRRGKFAVDQQVGHLQVRRLFRQLLDRVSPIRELSLVAVEERDGAAARRRIDEPGVEAGEAGIVVVQLDLLQLAGSDGAVLER
jgi:hypothetical protein